MVAILVQALWRIFPFPIHERFPAIVHLAVHLENGLRIYFNNENLQDRVKKPPSTMLTSFLDQCKMDKFAKTLPQKQIFQKEA